MPGGAGSLLELPAFGGGGRVHVVVESPRGARVKLKFETALSAFCYSRPLPEGISYPYDWGFVPSTVNEDGDPVDALVLHDIPTFPGTVIPCRPLGVLQVSQSEKGCTRRNDRVLFQPIGDPSEDDIRDVRDLPARVKKQLEQFFVAAALGTGKRLKFLGWRNAAQARRLVDAGAKAYIRQTASPGAKRMG